MTLARCARWAASPCAAPCSKPASRTASACHPSCAASRTPVSAEPMRAACKAAARCPGTTAAPTRAGSGDEAHPRGLLDEPHERLLVEVRELPEPHAGLADAGLREPVDVPLG